MNIQTFTEPAKQLRDSPSAKWIALACIVAAGVFDHIKAVDARKADAQHFEELKEESNKRWTAQTGLNNYQLGKPLADAIATNAVERSAK